ncbi:hypothetical protein GE061_018808 [Apolygus lucorum]|uniref:Peptidase S1 domain-containing protein n=1 Tax=Apolygus lucorum TaxID=248454 RepID=A0A8S9X8G0_APOLU|nr:hypothetical protein GE061_018808 [Apolygus lucorum]
MFGFVHHNEFDPNISYLLRANDIDQQYDESQAVTFVPIYEAQLGNNAKAKVVTFDRAPAGETEYAAILFGYDKSNAQLGATTSAGIQTQGKCGGILLTSDTVITLCACLASYLNWIKVNNAQGDLKPLPNAPNDYDIQTKDIYVWFGDTVFKPWLHDFRIKLTNDVNRQIKNNGWCYEAIEKCSEQNPVCFRWNPAVVKFDLPYSYVAETLIPWPPSPINICNHYDRCLDPSYGKCKDPFNVRPTITCFKGEIRPEICEGLFGSPVFGADFGLHGLAMNVYPCGTNTGREPVSSVMEVMSIDRIMADYIETLIVDLIDTSKEEWAPGHLVRDQNEYNYYEMPKYNFEVIDDDQHGRNLATIVRHFWIIYWIPVLLR